MKVYSLKEFAEKIGVSTSTVRNWENTGKIKAACITTKNKRYYSEEQIIEYAKFEDVAEDKKKSVAAYCRVNSKSELNELAKQVAEVKAYLESQGYEYKVFEEAGSGVDFERKEFQRLLEYAIQNEVKEIVVLTEDRFTRVGFYFFKKYLKTLGIEITAMHGAVNGSDDDEVVEEMLKVMLEVGEGLDRQRRDDIRKMVRKTLKISDKSVF